MGFRAITSSAIFLFSSIVAGYLSFFYLKPFVVQRFQSAAAASDTSLWIGLLFLLGAVALFGLFYRTLRQIPEPQ